MRYAPGLQLYLAQQRRRGLGWAQTQLQTRLSADQEDPDRGAERLGKTSLTRPDGPLVWFHAGGESGAMALPELFSRLQVERDDLNFLITTTRYNPKHRLDALLPGNTRHQYAPYDVPQAVEAFLAHWKPDIALWSDHDLHPALITATAEANIPQIMIDARMPDDVQHRWRWRPGMARNLLRCFSNILAADGQSARNFRRLGADTDKVEVTGFLQEGGAPLPCVQGERDHMASVLAARPVWLAAEVSAEEEETVLAAYRQVIRRSHRLLLILVPADPERGSILAENLRDEGWIVARRSVDDDPGPEVQILVGDQAGEMGLWYRLAPVTLIGQTFDGGEPRNPHEAAALGSAILFGAHPARFAERFNRLAEAGAARRVHDTTKLAAEVEHLLAPDKAAGMATAAWEVSTAGAEVTDRVTSLIHTTLDARGI